MKTTALLTYFEKCEYEWENDLENLSVICHFTKTRHNETRTAGEMSYGSEQCFLVKAIAQKIKAKKFFEIGTGRGTSSYSVALEPEIEKVSTVDIVSHIQKKNEAIGYRSALVSNQDLYEMIHFKEKEKIEFNHVSEYQRIIDSESKTYDLAFIDGDHTNVEVIAQDFLISQTMVKEDGIILFDDYHPSKFSVRKVVDYILEEDSSYEAELVCFHGHLFEKERAAKDNGIVVLKRR